MKQKQGRRTVSCGMPPLRDSEAPTHPKKGLCAYTSGLLTSLDYVRGPGAQCQRKTSRASHSRGRHKRGTPKRRGANRRPSRTKAQKEASTPSPHKTRRTCGRSHLPSSRCRTQSSGAPLLRATVANAEEEVVPYGQWARGESPWRAVLREQSCSTPPPEWSGR